MNLDIYTILVILGLALLSSGLFYVAYVRISSRSNQRLFDNLTDGLCDNSHQPVAITDASGHFLKVNSHLEKLFEYRKNELVGKPVSKLLMPERTTNERNQSYFVAYDKGTETTITTLNGRTKTGNLLLLEVDNKPLSHVKGECRILRLTHSVELPKVNSPRDPEHLIEYAYYDFAPFIFLALDLNGNIVKINQCGLDTLSTTTEEILHKNWFEHFLPKAYRKDFIKQFRQCVETRNENVFQSVICDSKDCEKIIQWKCGIIDMDSRLDLVLFTGEDITFREKQRKELISSVETLNALKAQLEEKVIERTTDLESINVNLELQIEERKAIEQKLITSQALYREIAHNFPNGLIAVLDKAMNFVFVDGQELVNFNVTSDEIFANRVFNSDLKLFPENTRKALKGAFEGQKITLEITLDPFVYNVVAVPLADYRSVINEVLVVMHNITESKRLEESLYRTIDQEKKLNDLKSRFVTMASHEFRTPLSTILSSVFLMESYTGALYEEKKHIHIQRIKRTVNTLTETLNDFLRLGKLEEGNVEMILSETDIEEAAKEAVSNLQSVARPGQIIQYNHSGSHLKLFIDKVIVRSIFTNLVSNSIKYSHEGDQIFLSTHLSTQELVITVKDQGIGIAPEEAKHIFQRFFRALNASNIEGTGLGLHIVKKYIELMDGSIDFASGSDGTIFTIKIPLLLTQDKKRLMLT
jgi:PAS domain S-box-containing protein